MTITNKYKDSIYLVMIFPVLFILMPRPDFLNLSSLGYLVLLIIFGIITLRLVIKMGFAKYTTFTISTMFLLMILM